MRLTVGQLRSIIKEEASAAMAEAEGDRPAKGPSASMIKYQYDKLVKLHAELLEAIGWFGNVPDLYDPHASDAARSLSASIEEMGKKLPRINSRNKAAPGTGT